MLRKYQAFVLLLLDQRQSIWTKFVINLEGIIAFLQQIKLANTSSWNSEKVIQNSFQNMSQILCIQFFHWFDLKYFFTFVYAIITIFDKTIQRRNQQRVKKDQILAAIQMCNLLDTDISNTKKSCFFNKKCSHTFVF